MDDAFGGFGPLVTGLLPIGLIVGIGVATWAYRSGRRQLAIGAAVVAVACAGGMAAFVALTRS